MPMLTPIRNLLYSSVSGQSKKVAFGIWNTIASAPVVATIARTPGISWIMIDAEHGQLNDTHIFTHSALISGVGSSGGGVSPLVRIPAAEAWWVKRALDSGAHGVMVPLLKSAAEVRDVVSWARYPPKGTRGFGPMYTHLAFGGACSAEEYRKGADDVLVIIQIENKDAMDNLEEIAHVEGLDVLFIGPYDLSLSLGVPFGGDAHQEAIVRVREVAHKYGKKAAIYCSNGAQARVRAQEGFDMISVATDVDVLAKGFAGHLATALGSESGEESVGSGYSAGRN